MDESDAVFREICELPNSAYVFEALLAYQRLTERDLCELPDGVLEVGAQDVPGLLQGGDAVLFHFSKPPENLGFYPEEVVIQIRVQSDMHRQERLFSFALLPVYHEYCGAVYPARVLDEQVRDRPQYTTDNRVYEWLLGRDMRAALIFSRLWRLQMGPLILDRNGEIAGAFYS